MIVAANKAEGRGGEAGRLEAYKLGLGDPLALSAEHGEGLVDLFEALRPHVERDGAEAEPEGEDEEGGPLKLAIVGRPNAGKSTLVNTMLGEERMITGPEAGITRDSISLDWEWQGKPVRLVDTAGLRKRAKVDDKLGEIVGVRHPPGDRPCRSRRAAARRHPRARSAGSEDRRRGARGGPRAGHRAQQMGRRRECLVVVPRASRRRSRKACRS